MTPPRNISPERAESISIGHNLFRPAGAGVYETSYQDSALPHPDGLRPLGAYQEEHDKIGRTPSDLLSGNTSISWCLSYAMNLISNPDG